MTNIEILQAMYRGQILNLRYRTFQFEEGPRPAVTWLEDPLTRTCTKLPFETVIDMMEDGLIARHLTITDKGCQLISRPTKKEMGKVLV